MSQEKIDNVSVNHFAEAMKVKLSKKRIEGYGGWDDPNSCSIARLEELLIIHLRKGFGRKNLVDIANFCMMIWNREQAEILAKGLGEND